MNIYVGNLSYQATEDDLREVFGEHGEVRSVNVIMDRTTGQSRGFAFVEMATKEGGEAALAALNGFELRGRPLKINEARPREERPRRESRQRDSR
jgi:RNA recognition motif-containing protein